MKYIFLVAWREYAENAKTKGFWLGIFLIPAIILVSIQVPIWLAKKGTPVRYYVLVDQSSTLAPVIEARLERSYQRQVLADLNDYVQKYAYPAGESAEPTPCPPPRTRCRSSRRASSRQTRSP